MSFRVEALYTVDNEKIAIQCDSICSCAEAQLKKLDEMLAKIEQNSTRLLNNRTEELKRVIEKEKQTLLKQIELVRGKAMQQALRGKETLGKRDSRYIHREDTINEATRLQRQVITLSSEKIVQFEGLLQTLLFEKINDTQSNLLSSANGQTTVPVDVQSYLDGIQDEALRQFVYLAYLQNPSLRGDSLLQAGQAMVNQTYESRLEEERKRIQEELKAAKVSAETIEKVTQKQEGTAKEQIAAMQASATEEIVGEKVRQKSIKMIMQAIKARGFIVDKANIKIKRDTNEVILVGLKPSGEKAEFRVFLDGKFIYDFHGYEGQACQKDIQPFLTDLEEVYGMKIIDSQEIWRNPDKISTMKYQAMNTNKNKN